VTVHPEKKDSAFVVRVWHVNVFLGALNAAVGNPGEKCRSYYFSDSTYKFQKCTKWD